MTKPLTVVAIVAAYNEADIIGEVVAALVEDGIRVYFIDHGSTDDTVARVEPFRDRGVIGIETFAAGGAPVGDHVFAWRSLLERKEELASQLNADWFIHHDADEFRESPWEGETLLDGIARVDAAGYNAIDFHVFDFKPTTADQAQTGSVRDRLKFYEPARVFDRLQVKCWKKTPARVSLAASGGHEAAFEGRRVFPIRFLLRHYPVRSQAHGERKVLKERLPRYDLSERSLGWHVQYDGYADGAPFVVDPGQLRRFDPAAASLEVFVRNLEVERLQAIQSVADQRLIETQSELDAAQTALRETESDLEASRADLRKTEMALRDSHAGMAELQEASKAERDGLQAEMNRVQAQLRDLEVERARLAELIAAIYDSKSWRITAPLRAVWRILMPRHRV